jgi:hypothetical protein
MDSVPIVTERDPLLTTLLDLDAALPERTLIIAGGYGIYLKQLHLKSRRDIRTLFAADTLPVARTTEDIDLVLRAELVTDSGSMGQLRSALDTLGFAVVDNARYTQFVRNMDPGQVKVDLLAAPLGEFADRVPNDPRRVKPRPSVRLHASKLEQAIAVDRDAIRIPVAGRLSNGAHHQTEVLIPQAFTYVLTKLCAFRDRLNDEDKDLGRHHALDLYRIVGLLTRDEDAVVHQLKIEFASHPVVIDARQILETHFAAETGLGRLRIREHPLYSDSCDLDRFANELRHMLASE